MQIFLKDLNHHRRTWQMTRQKFAILPVTGVKSINCSLMLVQMRITSRVLVMTSFWWQRQFTQSTVSRIYTILSRRYCIVLCSTNTLDWRCVCCSTLTVWHALDTNTTPTHVVTFDHFYFLKTCTHAIDKTIIYSILSQILQCICECIYMYTTLILIIKKNCVK